MPTVRRIGSARFFFYSNEGTEPRTSTWSRAAPFEVLAGAGILGVVEPAPGARASSPGAARGRTQRRVLGGMA